MALSRTCHCRRHKIPGGIVFLPAPVTASDFTARTTEAHPVFYLPPAPHPFLKLIVKKVRSGFDMRTEFLSRRGVGGWGGAVERGNHMVSPDMKKLGHRRCLLVVVNRATCFARASGSFAEKSAPLYSSACPIANTTPPPPASPAATSPLQLVISPLNKP